MKKLLKIAVAALMILALVGCGETANEPTTDEAEFKVIMLVPKLGDQSYFDTMQKGCDAAEAKYAGRVSIETKEAGDINGGTATEEDWRAAYEEVCADGEYDLIISANNTYEGFLYEAAKNYPDQMFLNCDASTIDPECKNVLNSQFGLDDLGYVVGALSASLTKSGIVGVVVGMENQPMNQFISGYCQVLTANDVKYVISYPGSFTDTTLGKTTTEAMIAKGADVIWQVAGGLGNGVIEACSADENVWCVGVDQDQYLQFKDSNEAYANTIVTSALKNTDVVIQTSIDWLVEGTLKDHMGETKVWGIADNGVGLAENDFYHEHVSEEIRNNIAAILQDVADGKVAVYDCMLADDGSVKSQETYEAEWPAIRDANRLQ